MPLQELETALKDQACVLTAANTWVQPSSALLLSSAFASPSSGLPLISQQLLQQSGSEHSYAAAGLLQLDAAAMATMFGTGAQAEEESSRVLQRVSQVLQRLGVRHFSAQDFVSALVSLPGQVLAQQPVTWVQDLYACLASLHTASGSSGLSEQQWKQLRSAPLLRLVQQQGAEHVAHSCSGGRVVLWDPETFDTEQELPLFCEELSGAAASGQPRLLFVDHTWVNPAVRTMLQQRFGVCPVTADQLAAQLLAVHAAPAPLPATTLMQHTLFLLRCDSSAYGD